MAEDKNDDLPDDRASLEAAYRKHESRAQVARRGGDDGALKRATGDMQRVREKLDGLEDEPRDLSGTQPTLSDSRGNFAPNPEVAGTGGTGVEASNSAEGGGTADSKENVDLSPAEVGITDGDKVVGDPDEAQVKRAERQLSEAKTEKASKDESKASGRKSTK